MSSFNKCLLETFAHSSIGFCILVFGTVLLLGFLSSLCIFPINPLSDEQWMHRFSCSLGILFILLMDLLDKSVAIIALGICMSVNRSLTEKLLSLGNVSIFGNH